MDDDRDPKLKANPEGETSRKRRPASFFRALALSAVASAAPAAGCYESTPDEDVVSDASGDDSGGDSRADDGASDAATDDAPEAIPPYGVEYGAPAYGVPDYGTP